MKERYSTEPDLNHAINKVCLVIMPFEPNPVQPNGIDG